MSRILRAYVAPALAFVAVLVVSASVSARIASRFVHPEARRRPAWEGVYTSQRLEQATARFTGHVSPPVAGLLDRDTTLAVVLRGRDLKGCEDLGRQLRALRRAAPARQISVWTEEPRVAEVRAFLHRERVSDVEVKPVNTGRVLDGGRTLATPAALLVLRDGHVLQGVSHPSRFPNMRLRSFAEELTLFPPGTTVVP